MFLLPQGSLAAWPALVTLLGVSIYGSRIDNEFDHRLLDSYIRCLFRPEAYSVCLQCTFFPSFPFFLLPGVAVSPLAVNARLPSLSAEDEEDGPPLAPRHTVNDIHPAFGTPSGAVAAAVVVHDVDHKVTAPYAVVDKQRRTVVEAASDDGAVEPMYADRASSSDYGGSRLYESLGSVAETDSIHAYEPISRRAPAALSAVGVPVATPSEPDNSVYEKIDTAVISHEA